MPHPAPQRRSARAVLGFTGTLAAAALALTACAGNGPENAPSTTTAPASTTESAASQSQGSGAEATAASSVSEADRVDPTKTTEVSSVSPRVLFSHDEGLSLVDPATGKIIHEQKLGGFKRLNNAGSGKDVFVTTENGWEIYSAGINAQVHGDHHHYYESDPGMTGVTFPGDKPGHVVVHNGRTTLFADGTGEISTFTSDHLDKAVPDLAPVVDEHRTEEAHHGVALELSDGNLLTTQGNEEGRNTVQVLEADSGKVLAETKECPGVHGEAAAAPHDGTDVVVLGCENGPVIYRDGKFHKVPVQGDYYRNGNLAGIETSPVVLGDRKVEGKKAEGEETERPTAVDLIDAHKGSITTVQLDSSYWFRSLGRAEDGSAVVLTYDGDVTVIDEETGKITAEIPAIAAWKEKAEWQEPGPILKVAGETAYVTDAENKKLVTVDLKAGKVVKEVDLPFAPVEMAVVTGYEEAPKGAGEHAAEDAHGHEGHDHADGAEGHEHEHEAEGHEHEGEAGHTH
ncbi:hypothetical protein [Micrococcus sp.]|uniref:hypothetical protein n=1 Tax=Micrococcus sp. TaxID=1271 RepID=UPI002A90DC0A|nr:hypothetical protein [Micrococcus sp.]MDY6054979.1 hypothetical protein [Micrococcus sp.]